MIRITALALGILSPLLLLGDTAKLTTASELIEQLGAPKYRAREEASRSLEKKRGIEVRHTLHQALRSKDAEIQIRAERLLRALLPLEQIKSAKLEFVKQFELPPSDKWQSVGGFARYVDFQDGKLLAAEGVDSKRSFCNVWLFSRQSDVSARINYSPETVPMAITRADKRSGDSFYPFSQVCLSHGASAIDAASQPAGITLAFCCSYGTETTQLAVDDFDSAFGGTLRLSVEFPNLKDAPEPVRPE